MKSNIELYEQMTFNFDGNFSNEMRFFVEKFNIEFDKGNIVEALIYFTLGIRIYEYHQDNESKQKLILSGTKCAVFLNDFPIIKSQLKQIIAYEMFYENYKTTASSYYMLSVIYTEENELDEALKLAKMSLFFAEQIDRNSEHYLFQAKSQIVNILILKGNEIKARNLLHSFFDKSLASQYSNMNDIVECYELLINYIIDDKSNKMELIRFLIKLEKSKDIMVSTYLATLLKAKLHDSMSTFATNILQKYYDKTIKINKILPHMPLLNSQRFFEACQSAFEMQKNNNGKLYLYKIQMNHVNEQVITNFIEMMRVIELNQLELFVHNYASRKFTIVLLRPIESLPFYEQLHFTKINSFLEIEPAHYTNFYEAYNLLTLKIFAQ